MPVPEGRSGHHHRGESFLEVIRRNPARRGLNAFSVRDLAQLNAADLLADCRHPRRDDGAAGPGAVGMFTDWSRQAAI